MRNQNCLRNKGVYPITNSTSIQEEKQLNQNYKKILLHQVEIVLNERVLDLIIKKGQEKLYEDSKEKFMAAKKKVLKDIFNKDSNFGKDKYINKKNYRAKDDDEKFWAHFFKLLNERKTKTLNEFWKSRQYEKIQPNSKKYNTLDIDKNYVQKKIKIDKGRNKNYLKHFGEDEDKVQEFKTMDQNQIKIPMVTLKTREKKFLKSKSTFYNSEYSKNKLVRNNKSIFNFPTNYLQINLKKKPSTFPLKKNNTYLCFNKGGYRSNSLQQKAKERYGIRQKKLNEVTNQKNSLSGLLSQLPIKYKELSIMTNKLNNSILSFKKAKNQTQISQNSKINQFISLSKSIKNSDKTLMMNAGYKTGNQYFYSATNKLIYKNNKDKCDMIDKIKINLRKHYLDNLNDKKHINGGQIIQNLNDKLQLKEILDNLALIHKKRKEFWETYL